MGQFKERCQKRRVEQPHKDTSTVEVEIKKEMLREFEAITLEEGIKLIANAGVLILPEWDIADAIVFDGVRKETKPLEGITYSNDHATLVMWSLKREENKRRYSSEYDYSGGMIVKRVRDTGVVEASSTTLEFAKFGMIVAEKEAKEKVDLHVKLERVLKAYNEAKIELASLKIAPL